MALEVTLISAEHLTINRRHISVKKSPYATVRTNLSGSTASATKPDPSGGPHPVWNQCLCVETPARALIVEVRCSSGSIVGTATIPKSEFSGGYLPVDYLHFLSYRLRDPKGEPNGIVNISVRAVVSQGTRLWQ